MKKFILQLIIVVCIGGFSGYFVGNYINERQSYREFEFRGGVRHSGGDYVRSMSYVLINKKNYDLEVLYQEIYNEFVLMNGEPDELTLYLYDSLDNLHNSQHFSERTFLKSPD